MISQRDFAKDISYMIYVVSQTLESISNLSAKWM